MAATPILDLNTLSDRPTVVINQTEYWLVTLDILPPLDSHRVQRMSARVTELLALPTLSEAEEKELGALPDRLCRVVLDAPDEVHRGLKDSERMLIVETAMSTFRSGLRIPPGVRPTPSPASPSIGESGSPD